MQINNIFPIFLVTVFLILVVPAHNCLGIIDKLDYTIERELNSILIEFESVFALLKSSKNAVMQAPILLKNLPERVKRLSDKFYSFNEPINFVSVARKFARTLSNIATIATEICISKGNNATHSYYLNLTKMLEEEDYENFSFLSSSTFLYTESDLKREFMLKNSVPPMFENVKLKTRSLVIVFDKILFKLEIEVMLKELFKARTEN